MDTDGETVESMMIIISNPDGETTKTAERTGIDIADPDREMAEWTRIAVMVLVGTMAEGVANVSLDAGINNSNQAGETAKRIRNAGMAVGMGINILEYQMYLFIAAAKTK